MKLKGAVVICLQIWSMLNSHTCFPKKQCQLLVIGFWNVCSVSEWLFLF